MTVVTGFFRVKAETIKILEKESELMDWLLGYSHDARVGERLGCQNADLPPQLGIGEAWDEILLLLAGTGHYEAYQALHISLWEEYDGCEEIRLFSPAVVKKGLAALDAFTGELLRREALKRDLQSYNGEPVQYQLDHTLAHFERLREFWRAAALADEAIISATG